MASARHQAAKELKRLLSYDPDTGLFHWKERITSSVRKKGAVAGSPDVHGYIMIGFRGELYRAHHLAFFYMTGELPTGRVGHRNGDKADNRFENLQATTWRESSSIKGPQKNNAAGFKGVSFCTVTRRFRAQLRKNGKTVLSSSFDTAEAAARAYDAAARKHFGPHAYQNFPIEDKSIRS